MSRSAALWFGLAALFAGLLIGRMFPSGAELAREDSYLQRLADELSLSPAQIAQVEALLRDEDRAVQLLVERAREDLAGPVAEHRQRTEDSLRAVLESEQLQLYDDLVQR
ncbi:MAG: hypothetical protein DHS20C15_18510 [Planctomycetota bacterium]|nr:MAG: hypothetical protein DHS20C15_18510 [Planctomycetota bacterium]